MRIFLAIPIPENLQKCLVGIQQKLASRLTTIRWEKQDKFHLTLVFLGEVSAERVPALEQVVARGVGGVQPFKISLNNLGYFPERQRPRVLWVGVVGDLKSLSRLQRQLTVALADANFSYDQRKFHPHITLGRFKVSPPRESLPPIGFTRTREFEVDRVLVMKSALRPTGSIYATLAEIPLKSSPEEPDGDA